MKKFIISFALLMSVFSVVSPLHIHAHDHEAIATEYNAESEITPRAKSCFRCGGWCNLVDTEYGSWVTGPNVDCTHGYPSGIDYTEKRTITYYYECDGCGYSYTNTSTQTRVTDCFGHY